MMTDSNAKTKGKGNSRAIKPHKSVVKSRPSVKGDAKTKRGAGAARPPKARAGVQRQNAKAAAPGHKYTTGNGQATGEAASRLIDQRIRDLNDWRGQTLARMRALILEADPQMIEEWKWMGTPVWSHQGIVCTGETYKNVVKLTFARGASIPDPSRLFNSSLAGNTRRAIDIHEGEQVGAIAFRQLVKAAVARNGAPAKKGKWEPRARRDSKD
jgi:hypothetical protein